MSTGPKQWHGPLVYLCAPSIALISFTFGLRSHLLFSRSIYDRPCFLKLPNKYRSIYHELLPLKIPILTMKSPIELVKEYLNTPSTIIKTILNFPYRPDLSTVGAAALRRPSCIYHPWLIARAIWGHAEPRHRSAASGRIFSSP